MRLRIFKRRGTWAVLACCALVITAPQAAALDYQRLPLKSDAVAILAKGIIMPGDVEALSSFINGLPRTDRVRSLVVNSPGGNLLEAERLASVITKYKLSVFVPPGSQCSSACFLIFAAASARFAAPDSFIGVHRVSLPSGEETATSRELTIDMARNLAQEGVPNAIVGKLVTTPPGEATWLTASDFASMGVQFIDNPRWR